MAALDLGLAREQRAHLDVAAEEGGHLVERDHVEGVRHRHGERPGDGIVGDGQQAEAACHVLREQGHGVAVGHHLRQVDALDPQHLGEHVAHHGLADEAEPHQDLAEALVLLLLFGERDAQLVAVDQALLDQELAQLLARRAPLAPRWRCGRGVGRLARDRRGHGVRARRSAGWRGVPRRRRC